MTKAKKNGNIPPLGMLFYIIYEIEAYQIEILGKPFIYVHLKKYFIFEVGYGNNRCN